MKLFAQGSKNLWIGPGISLLPPTKGDKIGGDTASKKAEFVLLSPLPTRTPLIAYKEAKVTNADAITLLSMTS